MMQSKWVTLDPRQLTETEQAAGVLPPPRDTFNIEISLSPYDVPEAVRGYKDEDTGRFVIEFRYIGDEPWFREKMNRAVKLRLGKNSGRLYGVELDVNAAQADPENLKNVVSSLASNAVLRFSRQSGDHGKKGNYEMASDVIQNWQEDIFAGLANR